MLMGAQNHGIAPEQMLENPTLLLTAGWRYAFAILTILTAHEMGHYLAARYHGLNVSLPFYIPVPIPGFFHFGTMGAFIRIRALIPNRKVLMDVAVSGPIAGFVMSLAFLFYGYATLPDANGVIAFVERIHPWDPDALGLRLGNSALFYVFNTILGGGLIPMSEIYHFPFIYCGWIGFFITALNLIPIGQLDGGHVVYSLVGAKAKYINYAAFAGILLLTGWLFYSRGLNGLVWGPWIIILLLIGLVHPPTGDNSVYLDKTRKFLGWLCILIFILCFIPIPFMI